MFNKIILGLLFLGFGFSASLNAQTLFNDTMLFQINRIKTVGNNFRYLMEFETVEPNGAKGLTGTMVLNLCACYCDSIWDAWPTEVNGGGMPGGTATLDYVSSGNSGGGLGSGLPQRQRGRLNIWQMPGSFLRDDPFSLPVILRFDP